MVNPINYEEKRFIIVNDISKTLFYFFDFDTRSNSRHMEFEHFHSYYEIHILLSSNALHFIKGIPYHIQMNDFVLLPPSLLHKTSYPEGKSSDYRKIRFPGAKTSPHPSGTRSRPDPGHQPGSRRKA